MRTTTVMGVAYLRKIQNKPGAKTTWEVLTLSGFSRIGIVEKRYSPWLSKRVGWQEHPEHYWIGHKFISHQIFVGRTRLEVLRKMRGL